MRIKQRIVKLEAVSAPKALGRVLRIIVGSDEQERQETARLAISEDDFLIVRRIVRPA